MRPSPPGEEALSLFPQVNVCHTAIMVSFDHTEDPQLEGRRMRTRSAAAQAQRRQEPPKGTGREQAGRGPGPCGPSDPPPGPDARGQVRPVPPHPTLERLHGTWAERAACGRGHSCRPVPTAQAARGDGALTAARLPKHTRGAPHASWETTRGAQQTLSEKTILTYETHL